jgi:hypothetical protein
MVEEFSLVGIKAMQSGESKQTEQNAASIFSIEEQNLAGTSINQEQVEPEDERYIFLRNNVGWLAFERNILRYVI